MAKDKKKFNDNTTVQINPTGQGVEIYNHDTGKAEQASNDTKGPTGNAKSKNSIPQGKIVRELSFKDKKTFVQLMAGGANSQAIFSYLGLNQKELAFYTEKLEQLKKEVSSEEAIRGEKLRVAQVEAHKINEVVRKTGAFPSPATAASDEKWQVPDTRKNEFLKQASIWSLDRIAQAWGKSVEDVAREIKRLESGN